MKKNFITKTFALFMVCNLSLLNITAKASENYPTLKNISTPEEVGFDSSKLALIDKQIEEDVNKGFAGAVLLIIKDGKIVKNTAYGYKKKYDASNGVVNGVPILDPEPMTKDTMFDLASNTKMYATNFALQKLVSEKKLNLKKHVKDYIPEFCDKKGDKIKGKNKIRVIDVLHHTAGFEEDPKYYNDNKISKELWSQDKDTTLKKICMTPLQYPPGSKTVYSDIDYMILGFIVEKIVNMPLDEYVESQIYKPLGLTHTLFNPLQKGYELSDFAATEINGNTRAGNVNFKNIREHTLQGEVHDEKAFYSMGGVSGHAGLFSNTYDLAVLLQTMLNGGGYRNVKLFDKQVIDMFLRPSKQNKTFGLGWRLNTEDKYTLFGDGLASHKAYGHTGWTGTLTLIDPEYNLGIVLFRSSRHAPIVGEDGNDFEFTDLISNSYSKITRMVYESLLDLKK